MINDDYELRYLESVTNVKSAMHKVTGRRPSTAVAQGISIFLQQGRMFLESANSAPLDIKPLILYYGISAYAKAIVSLKTSRAASTQVASHGMKDISEHNSLLKNLTLRIEGDGLIQAFNDAIRSSEGLYYYEAAHLRKHLTPTALAESFAGHAISFKDVLSRIGGQTEMYERTFHEKGNAQAFSIAVYDPEHVSLVVEVTEPLTDKRSLIEIVNNLRGKYQALADWGLSRAEHAWGKTRLEFSADGYDPNTEFADDVFTFEEQLNAYIVNAPVPQGHVRRDFAEMLGTVSGGQIFSTSYFVVPYRNNHLSELTLELMGMFMLSSLVRYRPQSWIHAISHASNSSRGLDDEMLALVEQFMYDTVTHYLETTKSLFGVQRYP